MAKVGILFPGQGAQRVGMARPWCEQYPACRALFDRAREVLGYDLASVCFDGPEEKLNSTIYSQPAIYVASFAALEVLRATRPEVVAQVAGAAGLSLGEYTAIAAAGGMTFEDGLQAVQRRGEAMQAASDARRSGMVTVIGLPFEQVEALCDECRQAGEILMVANRLNSVVNAVSGDLAACERLALRAPEVGASGVNRLAVAGAFHTPIMESAVPQLAAVLESVPMQRLQFPVYSNVDGQAHHDPEEYRPLLVKQVCSPVLWESSLKQMLADGLDEFWEVGPKGGLQSLLKKLSRKTACFGLTGE